MAEGTQPNRTVAEDAAITGDSLGPRGSAAKRNGGTKSSGQPGDLSDIASDLAGIAVEQGRTLLESAKGQATSFVDQRKDGAAQSIADLASSLRSTGEGFEDRPNIQSFVGSAADGLDQLADAIRDRSLADLYGEVEDYARRQPMIVGAGALLAGFILARFIKSSAEDMAETRNAARGRSAAGRAANAGGARPRARAAASARA